MYKYIISKAYDGYTIRDFLASFKTANSKINRIINEKKYLVNGQLIDTLKENDELIISDVFNETIVEGIDKPLDVLFENNELLVVDKPQGIIIHGDDLDTLDKRVAYYLTSRGYLGVPRHLYRLDKDTTGVMVYVKDPLSLAKLSNDLENNLIEKYYSAICYGKTKKEDTINLPLGKDRHVNNKMIVYQKGKKAITLYQMVDCNDLYSLLKIKLVTGRTHQIRVHMAYINHPVVGDTIYGKNDGQDLMLQCATIKLTDPITKKDLTFNVRSKLHL